MKATFSSREREASTFGGPHMKSLVMPTLTRAWNTHKRRCFGVVSVIMGLVACTQLKAWCAHSNTLKFSEEKFFQNQENYFLMDPVFFSKIWHLVTHRNKFRNFSVTILEWPGNSPDISPIENLWSICKQRLHKMDCSTMEKLIQNVIQVWYIDPKIL